MIYSEKTAAGKMAGIKLSKFTLGTVQLGMDYGMANTTGKPSEEQAFEILDTAVNMGVNSLDTAVAYGNSEDVIGAWNRKRHNPVFITSKFRVKGDDPASEFTIQKEITLSRLGRVCAYFFHDAGQMRNYGQQLREPMERMLEAGETKLLGASVYEPCEVEAFLDYDWLRAIQFPMSILDGRVVRSGLLEELQSRNVIVFVRSVFLQGLLCMEHVPKRYEFLAPYVEELRELAKSENLSLPELAVAYIRDLPGVTSLVLGCETALQVSQNADLISCKAISGSGIEEIRKIAAKVPIEQAMNCILGKS